MEAPSAVIHIRGTAHSRGPTELGFFILMIKKIWARKWQNVNAKFTLTRGLSLSKHFSFENTQPFFREQGNAQKIDQKRF